MLLFSCILHVDKFQHVLDAKCVQKEQELRPPAPVRPGAHAPLPILHVWLPRARLYLPGASSCRVRSSLLQIATTNLQELNPTAAQERQQGRPRQLHVLRPRFLQERPQLQPQPQHAGSSSHTHSLHRPPPSLPPLTRILLSQPMLCADYLAGFCPKGPGQSHVCVVFQKQRPFHMPACNVAALQHVPRATRRSRCQRLALAWAGMRAPDIRQAAAPRFIVIDMEPYLCAGAPQRALLRHSSPKAGRQQTRGSDAALNLGVIK